MKKIFAAFILLLMANVVFAQQDNTIKVVGDSLFGKTLNGESIREVHGHVVMTQDNVTITCEKAIQYIARNEADLFGNVVVTQDSIIIHTDSGHYFGDTKIAYSESGVKLFDGHVYLHSKSGYYFFDEKRAFFFNKVSLYDSVSTLTSDSLTYFDDDDKAVAVGNVKARDSISIIYADSLIHLRKDSTSFAFKNVRILDIKNKMIISGNKLEDYQAKSYSKITGKPFLIRIDSTDDGKLDTLIISSVMMEAYSDSTRRLIATDSVKIVRGEFASVNGYTEYFKADERLYTYKRDVDLKRPVIWNDNTQLSGDTLNILMKDNRIDKMFINSNASIITKNSKYDFRFDQISGKDIVLHFDADGLAFTDVKGNVLDHREEGVIAKRHAFEIDAAAHTLLVGRNRGPFLHLGSFIQELEGAL